MVYELKQQVSWLFISLGKMMTSRNFIWTINVNNEDDQSAITELVLPWCSVLVLGLECGAVVLWPHASSSTPVKAIG